MAARAREGGVVSRLSAYEQLAKAVKNLRDHTGKHRVTVRIGRGLLAQLFDELNEGGAFEHRLPSKSLLRDLRFHALMFWWGELNTYEFAPSEETAELLAREAAQTERGERIKLLKVDGPARRKGYRTGQIHTVLYADHTANPERGLLYWVQKRGARPEGFYRDQFRPKPKHAKTEKTQ